jgi:hypothetical protein
MARICSAISSGGGLLTAPPTASSAPSRSRFGLPHKRPSSHTSTRVRFGCASYWSGSVGMDYAVPVTACLFAIGLSQLPASVRDWTPFGHNPIAASAPLALGTSCVCHSSCRTFSSVTNLLGVLLRRNDLQASCPIPASNGGRQQLNRDFQCIPAPRASRQCKFIV